jgi:hypothetical protein
MKKYIQWILGVALIVVGLAYVGAVNRTGNLQGIQPNTIVGKTNTYTSGIASSTASRLLEANSGRSGLYLQVTGATTSVRFWLQSTSTGVSSSSGIYVKPGGSYTPEFVWFGEVWMITNSDAVSTATSTVQAQETLPQ